MDRRVNYRLFGWRIGIILAVFLGVYLLLRGQISVRQQEIGTLEATLSRLQEENTALDTELRQVDTEDYIVSSAMNNYAFMSRNDLRFEFTNPEALYAYTSEELDIYMAELGE